MGLSLDLQILFSATVAIAFILVVSFLFTSKKQKGETDHNYVPTPLAFQQTISESSVTLEQFIFDNFDVPLGWIIDTYTPIPTYPKNFDQLRGRKLFLFFSSLNISEAHIKLIKHVNEQIEKEKMDRVYKTVWIPIAGEKQWKAHAEDNYLLQIAERLSCYIARPHPECIRDIKEQFQLDKKNFLSLVEMDQRGHVEEYDPATTIVKERMARFGFKH